MEINGKIVLVCDRNHTMRTEKERLLKEELRHLALTTRAQMHLTQREMAELLEMSETSYSNIETGIYMCGTLTTVLLLSEQSDVSEFLNELKEKFKQQYLKAMQSVPLPS